MLFLLYSDFRTQTHREAFFSAVRNAGLPEQTIELEVISKRAEDLFSRLRTMTSVGRGLVVVGSLVKEDLAASVTRIERLRGELKPLAEQPFVLLARWSEWSRYPHVAESPFGHQLEYFQTNLRGGTLLVLPQATNYSDQLRLALKKHYAPESVPARRSREDDTTREMLINGRQTGQMRSIPQTAIPEAYPSPDPDRKGK